MTIQRAKQLSKLLNQYDFEYFTLDKPTISDEEYDALWFELNELLKQDDIKKALGKTSMPLGVQQSYLDKVTHVKPVLSLDKLKSDDKSFLKQLKKFTDTYVTDGKWVVQSKLDGLTIVDYRQNGTSTFATRGGSSEGENVTHQFKHQKKLMAASSNAPDSMIIRGEAVITKEKFEEIIETQWDEINTLYQSIITNPLYEQLMLTQEEGEYFAKFANREASLDKDESKLKSQYLKDIDNRVKEAYTARKSIGHRALTAELRQLVNLRDQIYSNARNLAASSIRTKDTKVSSQRGIQFIPYDIINSSQFNITTEVESLEALASYGFEPVKYQVMTTDELFDFFSNLDNMDEWRDNEKFEIDGLVIKPNEKIVNPKVNGHHVKGQVAIKFKSKFAITKLTDIEWQISHNGRMSPVAVFDPIVIGDSNISRAYLNSWKSIQDLGIKLGDTIKVIRSNDVIPQVAEALTDLRTGDEKDITLPENAEMRGQLIYATNIELPVNKRLASFMKRLGSKNVGQSLIDKLVNAGLIEQISDVFLLSQHIDEMRKIPRLGEKSIETMLREIELVKGGITFRSALFALSIEGMGQHAIDDLLDFVPTYTALKALTPEQVEQSSDKYGLSIAAVRGLKALYNDPRDIDDLHNLGLLDK